MTSAPHPESTCTLALIEIGCTLIVIVLAFVLPGFASRQLSNIEVLLNGLARKRGLAAAVVGATTVLLRLAILPLVPIPLPFVNDDFSFLLAADTFASGKLTNATPSMWIHFESFHITMNPTYMSMYFPAQGLLLAAGKVLFGHPWFALLIVDGLMSAALCWMLQVWLPPTWAFLGGMLAVLRIGLFSYWINTYTGGALITALGGALVIGSIPRLTRTMRPRYGITMAVGIVLLATARPYEGCLLCLPVAIYLGHWLLFGKNRPSRAQLFLCASFPIALIIAAGSWMAYYDFRVFGSPLTLPYTVNRATYAIAPYYVWQSPRSEPGYRHAAMREFYHHEELKTFNRIHSISGFIPTTLGKVTATVMFYAGMALLFPLIMLRRVLLDRRLRLLVLCLFVAMAGMVIEIFLIPHYVAPFTAIFYALGLQAMRHLRVWKPRGNPVGLALCRNIVLLCCFMALVRLSIGPLHIRITEWPVSEWAGMWYGPDHFGTERAKIEDQLERLPGKQLAIVRYSGTHNSMDEWVYNSANIDSSKVIWAREMDAANNDKLLRYYNDRQVWLVQPDLPEKISPLSNLDNRLLQQK
jgi:hypothetical protein